MKTINTLVISNMDTNMDTFKNVIPAFGGFHFDYSTSLETVIAATHAHTYDLLIIDTALDQESSSKLNKLINIIHPELTTLDLHLDDEAFIQFKLNSMQQKWQEAHSESQISFLDNPKLV